MIPEPTKDIRGSFTKDASPFDSTELRKMGDGTKRKHGVGRSSNHTAFSDLPIFVERTRCQPIVRSSRFFMNHLTLKHAARSKQRKARVAHSSTSRGETSLRAESIIQVSSKEVFEANPDLTSFDVSSNDKTHTDL